MSADTETEAPWTLFGSSEDKQTSEDDGPWKQFSTEEEQPAAEPLSQASSLAPVLSMEGFGQPEQPSSATTQLDIARTDAGMQPFTQEQATSANKAAWQAFQQPMVNIPRIPISPDDDKYSAAGKEIVNLALGVPEFFTSPMGVTALAGGAVAPTAVAGLFTADLAHSLGKQATEAGLNWDKMTPAQKSVAVTDMIGSGAFAAMTGHGTVKGARANLLRAKEAIVPGSVEMPKLETPVEAGQRAELIDRINQPSSESEAAPVEAPAGAVSTPTKPEVAEMGTNTVDKDKLGNPTGTKYHATPEDWAEWQEIKKMPAMVTDANGELAFNDAKAKRITDLQRKYGGTTPVEPKVTVGAPKPDWRVVVQKLGQPNGEGDYVQIENPRQQAKATTVEELKQAGHDVPDFSKLPKGSYTYDEAVQKLKEQSEPAPAAKEIKPKSVQQSSMAFDKLIMDHAAEREWARNPEALYAETGGGGQQGTASIKARIAKAAELKIARRNAAIDAGIDPNTIDTPAGRAAALAKLQEHVLNNYGEDYTLGKPETIEEQKARLASKAPKPKAQQPANERLGGDLGSAGQGQLFDEPGQKELFQGANDWTSATEGTPEVAEMGSMAPPKFPNRKMSPMDKVTASHSAKLQKSMDEARRAQKEIKQSIPDTKRREAAAIFREADGDMALLKEWEANAKQPWMREAAKTAQTLTPVEIATVNKVATAWDVLGKRGEANDVLNSFRDNYVTHIWPVKKSGTGWGGGVLQQRFKFAKARLLNTFFEGDQAGMAKPHLDIAGLLPSYLSEMNKVIADRQFVQELAGQTASDGRPLVIPRGTAKQVEGEGGKAHLVFPRAVKGVKDAAGGKIDQHDYRTMENQPALHDWRWVDKDAEGNPIMMQSDLSLHPEAYRRLNAMLGQSAIKTWYREPVGGTAQIPRAVARALDTAQSAMKREMFGLLAPFHQVQEGTHAVGHRVNPTFGVPKIDLRDPAQMDAARHGLMLLPDRASSSSYLEGVGSKSSLLSQGIRKLGKAGEAVSDVVDGYQDYLFHQYIPGLKFKTYEAMLGRNMKLYAKELASGEMTLDDVKITSAEQANAAYGHLNYALLDRNPTMQHVIRLGLLAPDFLEARGRFVGQAVKGLRSKVGHEQLVAVATIAAAQAGTAFVLSNLLGDKYDPKHPFEVIHNGRRYAMRSVPEDIFSLLKDTRQFAYGRINPLIAKGGIQLMTGLNYRGEKVTPTETMTELLAGYIPITARSLPGVRSLTETSRQSPISPLQQLAGSLGLRISRYSPVSETYKLAGEWMDKQKMPRDRGSYPISKYQQLRYALEDGDLERAKAEYAKLKTTMKPDKIRSGFKESVNHPFTGSQANDAKFKATLKGYDKELFEQALRTRKNILNLYSHL